MDASAPAATSIGTTPRLYGIVQTYLQRQLPRDIHPAFKALRDREEAAITSPHIVVTGDTTSPSQVQQGSTVHQISTKNNDDGLPLEDLYKDAASEKRLLQAAIEQYEDTTKDSKYKTNIVSDATHTWEDVLAEVAAASERYNDVSGSWGKIRKGLRSFGANSQVFDAWTGLLPTQSNYLSVLCGGLKLIFSAAARLKDLRTEVCEALAEIPVLLASTHRVLGAFKKSRELHECSASLYTATIAALRHIVNWYKENAIKKFSKSFIMQSSYERKLGDLIQAVKTHSQRFDDCARLCSYETIRHTNDTVSSLCNESRDRHQGIVGHLDRLKVDQFQQNNLLGNIVVTEAGNIQRSMGVLADRVSGMSEGTIKEMMQATMKQTLENFLSSSNRMDHRTQNVRGPTLPIRKVASESQLLRERQRFRQQLLTGLDYEDSVLAQDVELKLRSIWTLPPQDQDRVVAIMLNHKLQDWITTTGSSALFINANHTGSTRQNPTSFISAKLVDSLTPKPSTTSPRTPHLTIPLAYFCSEHLDTSDPDTGPDGMLRNLVSQLLLAWPSFPLRTLHQIHHTEPYTSTSALCSALSLLISHLPHYIIIFCIIDSISYFEDTSASCSDAGVAIQTLADIAERTNEEEACVFKVLVMSPWNSRMLYKEMVDQEEDVVWMPDKVPAEGGFTGMKWDASVGSNLAVTDARMD